MIALGVLLLIAVVWWLRRKAKRSLVAGLDKPAFYVTPPAGRVGGRKDGLL